MLPQVKQSLPRYPRSKLIVTTLEIKSNQIENLSVFDEDFEGSNDDDDVFDIDGVYTVFGNDTPEKGDSRYKPSGMAILLF